MVICAAFLEPSPFLDVLAASLSSSPLPIPPLDLVHSCFPAMNLSPIPLDLSHHLVIAFPKYGPAWANGPRKGKGKQRGGMILRKHGTFHFEPMSVGWWQDIQIELSLGPLGMWVQKWGDRLGLEISIWESFAELTGDEEEFRMSIEMGKRVQGRVRGNT